MPDISIRHNPTGEGRATLVDGVTGELVKGFEWAVNVIPREDGLLVQLRNLDETIGEEVALMNSADAPGAWLQAVDALRIKANEAGFTVEAVLTNDEQEEPTP
jgi:hypothetical protein